MRTVQEVFDYLIDHEYFTYDELHLVTLIDGWNMEVLNDCIYARYGYRSLGQMLNESEEEDD